MEVHFLKKWVLNLKRGKQDEDEADKNGKNKQYEQVDLFGNKKREKEKYRKEKKGDGKKKISQAVESRRAQRK